MRGKIAMATMLTLVLARLLCPEARAEAVSQEDRIQWFIDEKFGMFIHWGVYSDPAGEFRGEQIPGAYAEWIMFDGKIPVEVYEREIAAKFNPTEFNADEWVRLASQAGMKYLVITAKHHDGFAMYHSEVDQYNIVDFTPFDRDPMKELAEACEKYGVRFCFYYSQSIDWHHPHGHGNNWDYDPAEKDFAKYLEEKSFPQVRELLENYGPIDLMWFDTPTAINREQSRALIDLVHSIQPQTVISGRVGHHGEGDYREMGDNFLPRPNEVLEAPWGTSATMNHSYAYKKRDTDWKCSTTLIQNFIDVVCKGGTYLLNVGPTGAGIIPQESVERLEDMGRWMEVNSEAIYYTRPYTTSYDGEFVRFNQSKDGEYLYAFLFKWPGEELKLETVRLKDGSKIEMLGSDLDFAWSQDAERLAISMPHELQDPDKRPCEHVWVLKMRPTGTVALPTIRRIDDRSAPDLATIEIRAEEGAIVRYTLDGRTPGLDAQLYKGPFYIENHARIRARAFKSGLGSSQIARMDKKIGSAAALDLNRDELVNGVEFEFYEGAWSKVPDYDAMVPVEQGTKEYFRIRRRDNYGMRFTAFIDIPADGNYSFYTRSDDGSLLYINDFLVVDNDGLHGAEELKGGEISLNKGFHKLVVDYFERLGSEALYVKYKGPGDTEPKLIREDMLFIKQQQ